MTELQIDPAVLEGARKALTKWGSGASLERIAQEAGLSRVTLYRRGISREDILETLTAKAIEEYRAALWPALTSEGTGRDRLELGLRRVCEVAESYLGLLEALPAERDAVFHEDDPAGGEVMTREPFTAPLLKLLRDGLADGTLKAEDPEETATVLFNQVCWTYIHLRQGHRWKPERARDAVVRLTIDGVAS